MIEVTSEQEIYKTLNHSGLHCGVIAIDGASSSGKSKTADNIAVNNKAVVIHIDSYLNDRGETYVGRVQYDRLYKEISGNSEKLLVIEGICLIPILEKLNVEECLYIYVARISGNVDDYSDPELFDSEWLSELTQEKSFEEAPYSKYRDSQEWIDQQVRIYHKIYCPLSKAGLLYKKREIYA